MSLYKRGGVWWAYFYVDGIRHQESTDTANRRMAEQIERKLYDEAIASKYQLVNARSDMSFAELSAKFIAEGGATAYHLGRLKELLPFFSDTLVLRISKGQAEEYRQWRKKRRQISDATVNRDLGVLRHILFWAVDNSMLLANPLSRLRMVRERRTKRSVLSVAEEQLLLPACSKHFRPIVTMALDTGMRRGELLQQRWEDVDFDRRLLAVTRSKTPEGESREIPLTARLAEYLRAKRQQQGLVFTFHDKPIHRVKTAWKTALNRSQVRRLRFHDLRHTFNTRLMEAGIVQDVRKALMGHSSGQEINAAYTHVELPAMRAAIAKLEVWVQEQATTNQPAPDKGETEDEPIIYEDHQPPAELPVQ